MQFKKIMSWVLSAICLCTIFSTSAFADNSYVIGGVAPAYEYANIPTSELKISSQTAYCTSKTEGVNTVSITVEQTLEKYSGWFWIWDDVDDASWSKTVNRSSISFSNTKSGLDSGTYRLKSVFTLTGSNGKTETITIYSNEKTIG